MTLGNLLNCLSEPQFPHLSIDMLEAHPLEVAENAVKSGTCFLWPKVIIMMVRMMCNLIVL